MAWRRCRRDWRCIQFYHRKGEKSLYKGAEKGGRGYRRELWKQIVLGQGERPRKRRISEIGRNVCSTRGRQARDGRQLAAALALGACGVQVGTCLLASEECPIHENYKAALLKAKDSDTIVTGRTVGAPVRVLKNRMSREYVRQEKAGADKMELEKYTLGSLRRAVFEGDTDTGSLMAGQVAGMLHEVRPVADILADLWQGGRQRIAALNTEC